jgi:hypothetical protein
MCEYPCSKLLQPELCEGGELPKALALHCLSGPSSETPIQATKDNGSVKNSLDLRLARKAAVWMAEYLSRVGTVARWTNKG